MEMSFNPITTSKESSKKGSNKNYIILEEYEPNIGAPFRVVLHNSVQQLLSKDGSVAETVIPNLDDLLKEIAFSRALNTRKFSPQDVRFVRKAVGLKAIDLADLLGVSPEHISRCEKGARVLSVAAEKLLRVIILKRRHNPAALANCFKHMLDDEEVSLERKKRILALTEKYKRTVEEIESAIFDSRIETVHSIDDLRFDFQLVPHDPNDLELFDEMPEDEWRSSDVRAA